MLIALYIVMAVVTVVFIFLFIQTKFKNDNLLKSLPCPIYVVDKNGFILYMLNRRYINENPAGLPKDESFNLLDCIIDNDQRDRLSEIISNVVDGIDFKAKETFTVQNNNGKTFTMMFTVTHRSTKSVLIYIDTASLDMRAESSINKLSTKILDSINLPVSVRDLSKHLEYKFWNKKAEELFAVSKDKIIGNDKSDYIDDKSAEELENNIVSITDNGPAMFDISANCSHLAKKLDLSVTQNIIQFGSIHWLLTCFSDKSIGDIDNKDIELLRVQCRMAMNTAKMELWIWNIQTGTIASCSKNRNYPSIYDSQLLDDIIIRKVKPVDQKTLFKLIDDVKCGRSSEIKTEFDMMDKQGSYECMSTYGMVYERGRDGSPLTMIGITLNIENTKSYNKKLQEAESQVRMSGKRQSTLFNNFNQVINVPLNSIIGYAQLMEADTDPQRREQYVQQLQNDAADLVNRVNMLMQIATINAGTVTFIKNPVEIDGLILESCNIAQKKFSSKGLTFLTNLPKNQTTLMIDNRYLAKIFSELLIVVAEHSENCDVTVGYKILPGKAVHVSITSPNMNVKEEKMNSIINMFTDNGISNDVDSDLGLPFCKSIVNRFGGDMGFNYNEHNEAEFWFTINIGY